MERRSYGKFAGSIIGDGLLGFAICFVLFAMLASLIQYIAGRIFVQLFFIVFYYGLLFAATHTEGVRDYNKVKFKHYEADIWWGFKCGIPLMVIYYIPYLILLYSALVGKFNWAVTVYKSMNIHLFCINTLIIQDATVDCIKWWGLLILAVVPLLIPVTTGIGYSLGFRRINPINNLVYIDPKKDKNKGK